MLFKIPFAIFKLQFFVNILIPLTYNNIILLSYFCLKFFIFFKNKRNFWILSLKVFLLFFDIYFGIFHIKFLKFYFLQLFLVQLNRLLVLFLQLLIRMGWNAQLFLKRFFGLNNNLVINLHLLHLLFQSLNFIFLAKYRVQFLLFFCDFFLKSLNLVFLLILHLFWIGCHALNLLFIIINGFLLFSTLILQRLNLRLFRLYLLT